MQSLMMSVMTIKMKNKQIIEKKLEIFLKEHEESKDRTERLEKIIETYAGRYHKITGQYYIRNDLDGEGYYK
jgi:hypothetical protein